MDEWKSLLCMLEDELKYCEGRREIELIQRILDFISRKMDEYNKGEVKQYEGDKNS